MTPEPTRYDLLYNPRLTVPDFARVVERWQRESERARATLDCYLDVPYGGGEAATLDLYRARGPSKGLAVFIHGGYWRALDKAEFGFLAPALCEAGITVAIPNYALCPKVEVRDIVMQMVQAAAWLYRNGSNFGAPAHNVHVIGHSAGGHLAAMLLTCLWTEYARDLPAKVVSSALSVSGLYDLREIAKVPSINNDVRLTEETALQVSPAFIPPATDAPIYTAVGSGENEGFHIQNAIIAQHWKQVHAGNVPCPGANHFTVLDQLARPDGALFGTVMRMMGI